MTDLPPHNGVSPENGPSATPPTYSGDSGQTPPMESGSFPPKKGLPKLTIGLIIGGGVLLIAMIVAAVLIITMAAPSAMPKTSTAPDIEWPSASDQPLEPETDSGASGKLIPIYSSADFGGLPFWSIPVLSGWEPVVVDEEGVTRLTNSSLGCTFTAVQLLQAIDSSSSGDESTTMKLMAAMKGTIYQRAPLATESLPTIVELPVGIAGSSKKIEFASSTVNYSTSTNDVTSVLFARSMPRAGVNMYTHLECLRSAIEGPDSPLQQITEQLAVVPAP